MRNTGELTCQTEIALNAEEKWQKANASAVDADRRCPRRLLQPRPHNRRCPVGASVLTVRRAPAPGKRFCKQCGSLERSAPAVAPTPAAIPQQAAPATLSCAHCGAAIAAGKPFCKQCGQPVDLKPAPAQVDPVPLPNAAIPAAQSAVPDSSAAASVPASAKDPDVAFPTQSEPAGDWTSAWEPAASQTPLPSAPPPTAAFTSFEPQPEPPTNSKSKLFLAIGVAAAVLLAAGGALAWHFYAHRAVPAVAQTPAQTQQATATPPSAFRPHKRPSLRRALSNKPPQVFPTRSPHRARSRRTPHHRQIHPKRRPNPLFRHTKAGNCSASSPPTHIRSAAFRNPALSRSSCSLFSRGCL